ncbi:MAG TPA: DUF4838 domain-containing protein [Chthoniobacteraceae bacterium]|nr:DUF4838 domain-containing protein [Chthoniobacteraceae bacterium]
MYPDHPISRRFSSLSTLFPTLLCALAFANEAPADSFLVKDGEPRCLIVYEPAVHFAQSAAAELQQAVEKASGARIDILPAGKEPQELPEGWSLVHIGDGPASRAAGIAPETLPEEAYRLLTRGQTLYITGHDLLPVPFRKGLIDIDDPIKDRADMMRSPATLWGVHYLLDRHLGVRWLWPGELGTWVPRAKTLPLPVLDINERPQLEQRLLRTHLFQRTGQEIEPLLTSQEYDRVRAETTLWLDHHQIGCREGYTFKHAFGDWVEKYWDQHPDYFALPPSGKMVRPNPHSAKLRLGNPEVRQQIVAEWKEAGSPDYWIVSPTDGVGFCTDESTREMDLPDVYDPQLIWRGPRGWQKDAQMSLTRRYILFWNLLLEEMRKTNPDIRLASYAYSAYREAPPVDVKVDPAMVIAWVHSYDAYDSWWKWADSGATMILRPNWWHIGGSAPNLPLRRAGSFLKFTQQNALKGISFDSLYGNWSTQGVYYYLVTRLAARPELSVEEVIREYCSGFGSAAPVVREYLRYWEQFTEQTAYTLGAGGNVEVPTWMQGTYNEVVRQYNLHPLVLKGSWDAIPFLYTDDVLAGANAILDRAREAAANDPAEVAGRVRFLADGLAHLKLHAEVIRLGQIDDTSPQFVEKADELRKLRRALTLRQVLWGEMLYRLEAKRGVPTFLTEKKRRKIDLEGL